MDTMENVTARAQKSRRAKIVTNLAAAAVALGKSIAHAVKTPASPLNPAQRLLLSFVEGSDGWPRDYKAPHAYRGTPPKPKTPRSLRGPRRLFRA